VSHPLVNLVSFTGGTVTGKHVGAAASSSFKKLSLELGGKNAMIVFDDCDFDATVAAAVRSSFLNSGQICLCSSRLFVQAGIYDRYNLSHSH
jgi:aminomuconate-semialdehyde/2-hydroxymuconate-6-semialdehyde dehydrogenase